MVNNRIEQVLMLRVQDGRSREGFTLLNRIGLIEKGTDEQILKAMRDLATEMCERRALKARKPPAQAAGKSVPGVPGIVRSPTEGGGDAIRKQQQSGAGREVAGGLR